jgi:hypothetical protein
MPPWNALAIYRARLGYSKDLLSCRGREEMTNGLQRWLVATLAGRMLSMSRPQPQP